MSIIRIPRDASPEVRESFRQIQEALTKIIGDRNVNHSGRRTINAGDAVDPQDYVTLRQLTGDVELPKGRRIGDGPQGIPGAPGTPGAPGASGLTSISVRPNGALDGNGSPGNPLGVRVDGVSIIINAANQLEVDAAAAVAYYAPLTTGAEPIDFISNGGGSVVMVPWIP